MYANSVFVNRFDMVGDSFLKFVQSCFDYCHATELSHQRKI